MNKQLGDLKSGDRFLLMIGKKDREGRVAYQEPQLGLGETHIVVEGIPMNMPAVTEVKVLK